MKANPVRIRRVRGSVGKIVKLLSGRDIPVTQVGSDAFVEHDKTTLEATRVNIPVIPDDCSDHFLDAIEGFIDHEVGHVLFTEGEPTKIAYHEGARVNIMRNIVEDVFVERKMRESFTGCDRNIDNLSHLFLERFVEPEIGKLKAANETDEKKWFNASAVALIRGLGGQTIFLDWLKEQGVADKMPEFFPRLEALKDEIEGVRSSWDSLEIARKIIKAIKEVEQKRKQEEEQAKQEQEEEGNNDDEQCNGDKDAGEPSTESESETSDKGDDEDQQSSDGDSREDGEDSEPGDGEGEEERSDGSDDGGDESDQSDSESDGADAGGDEGESSESEPRDNEADSEGSSSSQDANDEAGTDGTDTEIGLAVEGSDSGASEDSDEDDVAGGVGGSGKALDCDSEEDEEPFDITEFDKAMAYVLTDMASQAHNDSKYVPFATHQDVIEPLNISKYDDITVEKVTQKIDKATCDMVGPITKQLERAFRANNKARWENGKRSGRLNTAGLHRLSTNDDRVFRKKAVTKTRQVAVTLLIDMSGSMASGNKINMAVESAWALAAVLHRLQINFEVLGFTTINSMRYTNAQRELSRAFHRQGGGYGGGNFVRAEPIYIPILKSFNENLTVQAKQRIACASFGDTMYYNIDGESVRYAANRLLQQKEEGKTLIVLSDGMPCGAETNDSLLHRHLRDTVKDITKEGINVVGLGILSNAVERFYPKSVVLHRTEDLPGQVVAQLRDAILKKAS